MNTCGIIGWLCGKKTKEENSEETILLNENKTNGHCCSGCLEGCKKSFLPVYALKIFLDTFLKAEYTTATLLTDLFLNPDFWGFSYIALGLGVPVAILFAWAQTAAHVAESDHFNRANHAASHHIPHSATTYDHVATPITLTLKEKMWAGFHYISDSYDGMAIWLLLAKLAGVSQLAPSWRYVVDAGIAGVSFWAQLQELKNTGVAFKEEHRVLQPTV